MAVVGAGPAGIAAALAAARAGARVVVVDEQDRAGGQVWRRPAEGLGPDGVVVPALAALERAPVEVVSGTLVWGVDAGGALLCDDGGRIAASAVVVATGAYDRPVPVPGWTLPGVLGAGGAQALVKGQRVLPGRRVVVAGAGPFLLVAALGLAEAGAEVVAVLEATTPAQHLRRGLAGALHPARLADLARYRARLARSGVPVLHGCGLVRVEGGTGAKAAGSAAGSGAEAGAGRATASERVTGAVCARLDAEWRPRPGTERRFDVDCVCLGYGFVPAVELAAALGCALRDDARGAQRVVAVGREQETSVAGVFAAGEATGVGGAPLASAEGEIAGAAAARWAGFDARAEPHAYRRRRVARHLARLMADLYTPRAGAWELATGDTPLCRCEGVSAGEVRAAIRAGAATPGALKTVTRVGMGPCQGRLCGPAVAHELGLGAGGFTPRPPIRPVPLDVLIGGGS